ncbi:MAG: glycerophosphodiester phosphodiesterase [Bacteroidia bacterium]|nr:glycerophosphodiester phosphodiesterase [Bacteroidia bacterium]
MHRSCYILLWSLIILSGCRSLGPDLPQPLLGGRPLVLGHAGRGFVSMNNGIPPNSMAALIRGIEAGHADGIEMDVQMSGDSVPILFHGDVLENSTDCFGCPEEFTVEEIVECRYNQTLSARLGDYPLVKLEDAMTYFATWPKPPLFSLNIKVNTACPMTRSAAYNRRLAAELVKLIHQFDAHDWTLVECPSVEMLLEVQKLDPDITIMVDGDDFDHDFPRVIEYNLDGIVAKVQSLSREQVQTFHDAGKQVVFYGIQIRRDAIEALEKGADQLQCDDLRMVQEVLKGL